MVWQPEGWQPDGWQPDGWQPDDLGGGGSQSYEPGLTTETDSAFAVVATKSRSVGLATETDSAFAVVATKTRTLNIVTETDTALSIEGIVETAVAARGRRGTFRMPIRLGGR